MFQHLLHVNSVLDNLAYCEAQCVCVCAVVDLTIVHVPFLFLVHPWIVDMMFKVLLSLQTLSLQNNSKVHKFTPTWKYRKFNLPVLTFL